MVRLEFRTAYKTDAWRLRFGDMRNKPLNYILKRMGISSKDIDSILKGRMFSGVKENDFAYYNGDLYSREALNDMNVQGDNPYMFTRPGKCESLREYTSQLTRPSTPEDAWRILFGDLRKTGDRSIGEQTGLTRAQISGIRRRNSHALVRKSDFKKVDGKIVRVKVTDAASFERGGKIREVTREDAWFIRHSNFRGDTTRELSERLGLTHSQVANVRYKAKFKEVEPTDFKMDADGKVISTKQL